jgi:hypothetical protein
MLCGFGEIQRDPVNETPTVGARAGRPKRMAESDPKENSPAKRRDSVRDVTHRHRPLL